MYLNSELILGQKTFLYFIKPYSKLKVPYRKKFKIS